jgi:fructosamine-3-kinase
MSIYNAMVAATDAKDAYKLNDLYDDDFIFVRHQSNSSMNKAEMQELRLTHLNSDAFKVDARRCLYENDDVMVMHQIMTFPNGSKEALMMVNMLKAGKIVSTETGATPLPDA